MANTLDDTVPFVIFLFYIVAVGTTTFDLPELRNTTKFLQNNKIT